MRPQGFGQAGNGLEDLGWNDMGFEPPKAAEAPRDATHDAFGEDVVEHPRAHPTGLTPIGSPVHGQQAKIAESFNGDDASEEEVDETAELYEPEVEEASVPEAIEASEPEFAVEPEPVIEASPKPSKVKAAVIAVTPVPAPRRAPRPRSVAGSKGKAAFTLRLDPSRHLKLRLACAVDGRSAQQLVTDALDRLLDHMPELEAMAETAKRKG
jgi:hypothetical protein